MDYNAPSFSTDPNASYVGKTASTIGSKVPPKAAEYPQREIVHAIKAAGLTPTNNDLTQLLQAVSRGIWLGTFGGTADALTATMPGSAAGVDPVIVPALQPGMRVRGIAASANATATPKLTLVGIGASGGSVLLPIVGADGTTALAAGAWKAGQILTFDIDASGNARFGGGGLTSITQISQGLLAAIKTTTFSNATQTALSNNVQVPLVWGDASTADFTNNGASGFTCNTPGGYLIDLAGVVSTNVTASSANDCSNQILKNGASVPGGFGKSSYTATSSGTWVQYVHAFAFVVLAAGDVIKPVEGVSVGSGFGNANGSGHSLTLTKLF